MGLFGWLFKRSKPSRKRYVSGFAAAKQDRLTADWILPGRLGVDQLLKWSLSKIRERSRDLARNDDYMRQFLRMLEANVVGPHGIKLQAKVRAKDDSLDVRASRLVEEAWIRWGKRFASVNGDMTLREILRLALISVARDGEIFIRIIRGADNPFGFTLQLIEADFLDERFSEVRPDGRKIVMGVEKGEWGRPLAYWFYDQHPGENGGITTAKQVRVPAEDIIHLFVRDYVSQTRGIPWAHSAILKLRMLGAYQEAEVVAARVSAAKMGFYVETLDAPYQGGDEEETLISEVEPGILEKLPPGVDFKPFDPGKPNAEFGDFCKAILRSVASGLGCSYNILANDYEGVNYSSLRAAKLSERDVWMALQQWLIDKVLERIFEEWLNFAILTKQLPFSASDVPRLANVRWQPRRWDWVDPLKDVQAKILEIQHGLTSRTRVCAERGIDFEDVLEELRREKELMDKYGVQIIQAGEKPIITVESEGEEEPSGRIIFDVGENLRKIKESLKAGGNGNGKRVQTISE